MNDSPARYPLIAAAEQFSSRILLLDPNRDPLSDQAIVWQWSPMHDWDMDRDTLRQYVNLSEVKPVSGGTRLLQNPSLTYKMRWYPFFLSCQPILFFTKCNALHKKCHIMSKRPHRLKTFKILLGFSLYSAMHTVPILTCSNSHATNHEILI